MTSLIATSNELHVGAIIIGLLGGLAIFLYGMEKMSAALRAAAGGKMKALLARLTTNRFKAAATGAVVTGVIQSSSVTTVLVVGFITAGLMTLQQSVGVIMGANVGTTITAQIVAFKVTKLASLLIAVGFLGAAFSKRDLVRQYGAMLMGLGLIFLGMSLMSEATSPLRTYRPFIEFMGRMDNPLLAILVGAIFTAAVQSSSATTGIVIMLAAQGFLSLPAGIALAMGANIGTCVTALLAAIGKPTPAVRAAVVHVVFNVVGVLLWLAFIPQLADAAILVSPRYDLPADERLAMETPRQIANANTIFNVGNLVILIWFTGPLAKLAERIVPEKKAPQDTEGQPQFLDAVYLETPALALDRVRMEIAHLGKLVLKMIDETPEALARGTQADLQRLADRDHDVDQLYGAILDYLRRLAKRPLPDAEAAKVEQYIQIGDSLESIGDLIETNLVTQGMRRLESDLAFSRATRDELHKLYHHAGEALRDSLKAAESEDTDLARAVIARKSAIRQMTDDVMSHLSQRLIADEPDRVRAVTIEMDIAGQVKRVYDHAKRIAKVLLADDQA